MTTDSIKANRVSTSGKIRKVRAGGLSHRMTTAVFLERKAHRLLGNHPHFRGRMEFVRCHIEGRTLYVDGCLPSWYLKQLAQEALRELENVLQIENRIVVASPSGDVVDPSTRIDRQTDIGLSNQKPF